MTETLAVNRLVIVHGPAEPVVGATLLLVGLEPVWSGGDVTVWAPPAWFADRHCATGTEPDAFAGLPMRVPDYVVGSVRERTGWGCLMEDGYE